MFETLGFSNFLVPSVRQTFVPYDWNWFLRNTTIGLRTFISQKEFWFSLHQVYIKFSWIFTRCTFKLIASWWFGRRKSFWTPRRPRCRCQASFSNKFQHFFHLLEVSSLGLNIQQYSSNASIEYSTRSIQVFPKGQITIARERLPHALSSGAVTFTFRLKLLN